MPHFPTFLLDTESLNALSPDVQGTVPTAYVHQLDADTDLRLCRQSHARQRRIWELLSRYYVRDRHHRLRNAAHVDNSCKWAGGGFVSTVGDLVKFGNAMLYSYQFEGAAAGASSSGGPPDKDPKKGVSKNS